jgi:hypothetical protein
MATTPAFHSELNWRSGEKQPAANSCDGLMSFQIGLAGFEPTTSCTPSKTDRVLTENQSELTPMPSVRCTNGCTSEAENAHGSPDSTATPGESPKPADALFAAALAMIASLPLSDAEKAQAIRQLLQGKE